MIQNFWQGFRRAAGQRCEAFSIVFRQLRRCPFAPGKEKVADRPDEVFAVSVVWKCFTALRTGSKVFADAIAYSSLSPDHVVADRFM